jgi:antitoxin (DNA-binding transcriptional repressor) of toxin-antitoxin stability system
MNHVKTATVRDLRYHFPAVEARLREGKEIQITKRRRVIARLVPVKSRRASRRPPDFMAILKAIYGDRVLKVPGAQVVAEQRGRY